MRNVPISSSDTQEFQYSSSTNPERKTTWRTYYRQAEQGKPAKILPDLREGELWIPTLAGGVICKGI